MLLIELCTVHYAFCFECANLLKEEMRGCIFCKSEITAVSPVVRLSLL